MIRVYSEITKQKIVQFYQLKHQRIRVIQDVPFHYYYPNDISQQAARAFFKLPEYAFVYSFFGSIKPYKGLENLIRSFTAMASETDYLIIAGSEHTEAYTRKLQQLINGHSQIRFVPEFIADKQVQYYLNVANVMVLPFQNVEHSGSVDLCMSFKKPIITLHTPLLANLLSHQSELLFQKPDQLASCMKKAKQLELSSIGQVNYQIADQANYQELTELFA